MRKKRAFTEKEMKKLQTSAEEQQEKMRGGSLWRNFDFVVYMFVVIMIAFGVRHFLGEPIRVDGDSMKPTLLHNELMVVGKLSYWIGEPARGDIIICYYPGYTESCVKRVIGLPGEKISIVNGVVHINGAPLNESQYWQDAIAYDMEEVLIPAETVFVMGDNRNFSKDSRAGDVGPIPYSEIVGHVRFVAWPASKIAPVKKVTY